MKCLVLLFVSFTLPLVAASPGIRPRADAASYPSSRSEADFSIGAWVIPPGQAKKMFKLDLNRAGYVVVEIGVFPASGKDIDLYPTDFTLYVGDKLATLRPVSSDTIAEILTGRPEPPHPSSSSGVNTSVGASIGHVSYPDPVTGRRTSGTITETEAGVGIGGPAPQPCRGYDCDQNGPLPPISQTSPTQNANTVSQDLWEKSLPDGKTAHPVAGYLYFPKPHGKAKNAVWELRYENAEGKTRLPLPR
jgi:hypothetical protein